MPSGFTLEGVTACMSLLLAMCQELLLLVVGECLNCGWSDLGRIQLVESRVAGLQGNFLCPSLAKLLLCWVKPVLTTDPQVVASWEQERGAVGLHFGPGPLWSRRGLASGSQEELRGPFSFRA